MANQKIALDIHDIMQQMGIQRDAFQVTDRKQAYSGSGNNAESDCIQEKREADEDDSPHRTSEREEPTELVALAAVT